MSRIFVLSSVELLPLSVETEADSATEGKIPRVCSVPEFGFILGAVVRFHDGPDILLTVIGGGQGSTGRLWKQQTRKNRKYATAQLETYRHPAPTSQSLEPPRKPRPERHQVEVHKKTGTPETKLLIHAVIVLVGIAMAIYLILIRER